MVRPLFFGTGLRGRLLNSIISFSSSGLDRDRRARLELGDGDEEAELNGEEVLLKGGVGVEGAELKKEESEESSL